MSLLRPPWGWAIRLSVIGAAAISLSAPAFADRALQLSYSESGNYARITAKWADGDEIAPKVSARVSNQVLILSFDEKVTINLDKLKDGLPNWAAVTFMDPDGMTARIGLKKSPRLAVTTSLDLVAIDLIPEDVTSNPPKLVSPLVAKKNAEAEAKRLAAIPPPVAMVPLEVRGSQSGDSSRVAFYWDNATSYRVVSQADGELKLQFAKRAKPDLAYLRIDPPANLADFKGENNDKGYLVTIAAKDHLPIKHFLEGDTLVVDISKPLPPEAAQETPKVAPAPAKKPVEDTGGAIMLAPPKQQPVSVDLPKPAAPDNIVGGGERVTSLVPSWSDPAPRNGVVLVKAAPLPNGLELSFPFAAPAPAAVFSRAGVVWIVFAANADLKVDSTSLPTGYRARNIRVKDATLMRLEVPKGLSISAVSEESAWKVRIATTAEKPERFVKADRRPGDDGRARVEAMLIAAAGIVWFEDPVIGDQIAAAVSYGPSTASATPRDFVEASLPATAHGLAIAPKSDDVQISLEGERVIIAMASSSQTSPDAPLGNIAFAQNAVNPAFMDFAAWGAARGAQYVRQLDALDTAVAEYEPSTPAGGEAAMNLARFHIGHLQAHEAIGILRAAAVARPELETDPAYLGMRGAASYLAGRLKEAENDLSRGSLRNDPSAAIWRAMVHAKKGEWERAIELFRVSDRQMYQYSSTRGADFAVVWAEAALHANDFDAARRMATFAVTNGETETKQRGQLALANLKAAIEGPAAAWPEFDRLANASVEPIAVRAELRRLELGVPADKISAADAAAQLEALRFRWRGDEVEMATVGILADQYMRVGRFRDALLLAQSTAMRDANAPGSRDLRLKLADYFRRLFLNGEADRLDPIQAVALFYEFDDTLMPIGPDGDQMVRKLAQRLVAFDLLEPASALLQYQVDNRLRGVGKASVAVDLASIYLWDKRPDKALAALNTTRLPNLPKPLALERRLLEAAAYRDLGRYDHVVELVEPLDGPEPKSLLADAYWRDNKWPDAARALLSMLPPSGQASAKDANLIFKTAIAARMSKDPGLLAQLRPYAFAMTGNPNKASFDLITAQSDVSGASVTEAVRRLADAPRVDAFATAMKARFEAPRATGPSGETAAATPAAPKPG
jgi:tetratricopeptide (TPR) repeat protein